MSKSKVIWYEDPNGSGDIYRDDVDSKGKPIRIYRKYTTESSRAESSATPRNRRESLYAPPADKSTSSRQREKSRVRESIRGERRPSYTESGRREPYAEDSGRYADEPSEAYFDSSRQTSTSYQPRDAFEPSSSSRQIGSPQPRHLSPRPFDPGTGDPLADSFDALHVSSDQYYTHSPRAASASLASTARDWQPRAVSGRREDVSFLPPERDASEHLYATHDHHKQEPLSTAQTQQDPPDRVVTAASAGETIDPSYQVRNNDWKDFFRIGRVFSTLWTDSLGNNASKIDPTFVSEVKYGERVYSKIRRFIVVREGDRAVSCLPVTSYASAGIRKSGIRLNEHGFIYSRNKPRKVDEMCSRPLKLNLGRGAAHLKDPSLVNYGKVYNVETNVKVKNVGTLDEDSKDILLRYYKRIFVGADPDPASVTPRPGDAVLAGVGAALHAWPAPVTPGSYASATSRSDFMSASAVSGYPPSSTMLGAPHQVSARAGPSSYYPPGSQYETPSSASYYPTSNTYGMGSALDPGPSSYSLPSMHAQAQYPSTQMASSSRGLTYSSDNMMDPSRRSSTGYYPASNRDSYPYQQPSSTAFPPNDPGYSSGYYQQTPSNYPLTSAESDFYSQSGSGFGQVAEQYPPQGGNSSRLPYSGPALPSAYDDDIDLSVDPTHEAALARKRRESRADGRRRPPGR